MFFRFPLCIQDSIVKHWHNLHCKHDCLIYFTTWPSCAFQGVPEGFRNVPGVCKGFQGRCRVIPEGFREFQGFQGVSGASKGLSMNFTGVPGMFQSISKVFQAVSGGSESVLGVLKGFKSFERAQARGGRYSQKCFRKVHGGSIWLQMHQKRSRGTSWSFMRPTSVTDVFYWASGAY